MNRLAVVSNRLPALDGKSASAGGLAVALGAALKEMGGTWVGWDGEITSDPFSVPSSRGSLPFAIGRLSLSQSEYEGYYLGFANRALWPLFHSRTDLVHFNQAEFETYRAANRKFAKRLAPLADGHELIWVHDYHLLLAGKELRRLGVEKPLGFFLHVPFPPPDILATLPCHRELIAALSFYDLVGFQTQNDVRNFHAFVTQSGGMLFDDGTVFAQGRKFRVGSFPIGIDTRRFEALAASQEAETLGRRLKPGYATRLGVIGVDRLDYTKGLAHRLLAFERMLDTAPEMRQKVFLTQIAAPSREDVPEYQALKTELEALSGHINARYTDVDWTPVRYINRALSQTQIAALYRLSRVGLVTPLKDGMNLVAKEYIASQNENDPGVLVLSRFAGAAEQMDGAIQINPYDVDGVARSLRAALQMPLYERRQRWTRMIAELRKHDVHAWRDRFLNALSGAGRQISFTTRRAKPAASEPRRLNRGLVVVPSADTPPAPMERQN